MRFTYDPKYNIAYIKIGLRPASVETLKISEELNIDITPDGKIYGFELLNAKKQLHLIKGAQFVFTNALTGKSIRLPLNV